MINKIKLCLTPQGKVKRDKRCQAKLAKRKPQVSSHG